MFRCVCTAARVLKKITVDCRVYGVTSVDNELIVLLDRFDDQVAVYSVDDYQLLRHLNLPDYLPSTDSDITSCVRHKCVYVSDSFKTRIIRYQLPSNFSGILKRVVGIHVREWSVPGRPCGLSVTPSCNLLVTCREPNRLVELSADSGECVREIALREDIGEPWHGVQLAGDTDTGGQFVVCHSGLIGLHRVCLLDGDGRIVHSYGGRSGNNVGQLKTPSHLAVDPVSQFVFVADCQNARVVLLSPTLEFVRYVDVEQSRVRKLHLDHARGRLYFGPVQRYKDVAVIQL